MHKNKKNKCTHEEHSFDLSSFFLGVLLVFVGLLFLGQNLEWFEADFHINWGLVWPVLVILIGMSMIKLRGWAGIIFGIILSFIIMVVILFAIFGLTGDWNFLSGLFSTVFL